MCAPSRAPCRDEDSHASLLITQRRQHAPGASPRLPALRAPTQCGMGSTCPHFTLAAVPSGGRGDRRASGRLRSRVTFDHEHSPQELAAPGGLAGGLSGSAAGPGRGSAGRRCLTRVGSLPRSALSPAGPPGGHPEPQGWPAGAVPGSWAPTPVTRANPEPVRVLSPRMKARQSRR